jgi:hypothetical protein
MPLDMRQALAELQQAAAFLGLELAPSTSIDAFWRQAISAWAERFLDT